MGARVGVLTFSDGRKYVHDDLLHVTQGYQDRLVGMLEHRGVEVVAGSEIIWNPEGARRESRRIAASGADLTIFNYAIWAFPHLSAIASQFAPGPYLLFCNLNPSEPGMVGMLAAAGTMEQLGRKHTRVWGDIGDPRVQESVFTYVRAAAALSRLRGQTFGLFGGRPLGMYTAVANLDQWSSIFGVDVEHVEQEDIVRAAKEVDSERVDGALQWLEKLVGSIRYDGRVLTPEKLKTQIRSYHAVRTIMEERQLDFVGFKAHGDLTDRFVTMDVAEAFLNDPYDWEGPHEPVVAATEADMDGALTMQILKHITGQPVLFSDVRHYDAGDDVWYFANSGTHPTFFAARSFDPAENLAKVTFYPEVSYYPAGGASVQHFAAAGPMTFARLARKSGSYHLSILPGRFVDFPAHVAAWEGGIDDPGWPHAFARLEVGPDEFLATYPCNHIHGVCGDCVRELEHAGAILGIPAKVFRPGQSSAVIGQ